LIATNPSFYTGLYFRASPALCKADRHLHDGDMTGYANNKPGDAARTSRFNIFKNKFRWCLTDLT
jgi:hypothetical protein